MVSINKLTEYGIRVLIAMKKSGGGTVSSVRIAEIESIPGPMLMKVLRRLKQAGLVTATRGRGDSCGGYSLAVDPRHCSLMELISRLEGGVSLVRGIDPPAPAEPDNFTAARGKIASVNARLKEDLARITLEELSD